jgi:uncharacterized protein YbjT (DUF2867 family)
MADTKKIVVVAGATGRAGSLIVTEALKQGYRVRALIVPAVDPPDHPGLKEQGVELVEGGLESTASLEKVMAGADYLISAIGSKKPFSSSENDKVDNMGNQNLVRAAQVKGLKHVVVISSIGAGNSRNAIMWLYRVAMGPVLKAKEKSENFIRSCGIDYTIIRPGGYSADPLPGEIVFGEGGKITGRITREQIARVCVDALTNPAMKNRTLEVVTSTTVKEDRRQFLIRL